MSYSRINHAEEQQEACQKAKYITEVCKQLHITLDPIDWQTYGMWAPVKVHQIEIAYLLHFGQTDADDILRRVQIKLLEHAALAVSHARPGLKASMWIPVDVVQPQPFLSFWIITLENSERVPIIESLKDGQRVYELYHFDLHDTNQFAKLFGPASQGEYHLGERITMKEHDHQYVGEIVYVIPPGKAPLGRRPTLRGFQTPTKTANEVTAKYIVDCNDGFPHIVHQSQVIQINKEKSDE